MTRVSAQAQCPADALPAALEVDDLHLSYDGANALQGINLKVARGEFVALLGPSGCGKTSLLRSIAGFAHPQKGTIRLNGRNVVDLLPRQRNIGLVFQSYALFPHLTVEQNVAFGLECRGVPKSEASRRVRDALATVDLTALAERRPRQLSGGQQQRVALARAIVIEPEILLLDEPLGALDKQLRVHMQTELRTLQQRLGIAAVFVTHDQEEAMSMADRVVVMRNGLIEQIDAPEALFRTPRTPWVSEFIGAGNLLSGAVTHADGRAYLLLDTNCRLELPSEAKDRSTLNAFILSDRLHLQPARGEAGMRVTGRRYLGLHVEIIAAYSDRTLRVLLDPRAADACPVGSIVQVTADPKDLHILN